MHPLASAAMTPTRWAATIRVMTKRLLSLTVLFSCLISSLAARTHANEDALALSDDTALLRGMVDELERSMAELVIEGLPRPYFLQYSGEDRITFTAAAVYGTPVQSNVRRSRNVVVRVRVGSPTLDNTNVGRGGGRGALPLDDDDITMRHVLWRLTDDEYKRAVEILSRKIAYLQDKTREDRPDDFSPAESVVASEPVASLAMNTQEWEERIARISAQFKEHPRVRDAAVSFFGGAVHQYLVNSEGTRLRTGDTGVYLQVRAEVQADDGMMLEDGLSYLGQVGEQLPSLERILSDIDELCTRLISLTEAPMLDQYTGPVLFDAVAAGMVIDGLLGNELCARPAPLGASGWQDRSLEKKIGLRILPRSFNVYDDPRETMFHGEVLAGAYRYDDEAVPAQRVSLVERGILKDMLASRSPTRKFKSSTGHGRGGGLGDPQAVIGCLYVEDENSIGAAELKEELIQAAREEGLDYGLRITALSPSGRGGIGSPIYAYKVYVEDGREEMVRGLQFLPVPTRALKRILAAGQERQVYNAPTPVARSVIAPALLFEELELRKPEQEFDKPPILEAPALRTAEGASAIGSNKP